MVKMRSFKEKLQLYCEFKGYIFNPLELLQTPSEQERNEIRKYQDNQDLYFFHIRAKSPEPQTTTLDGDGFDGDGVENDLVSVDEEPQLPF